LARYYLHVEYISYLNIEDANVPFCL